MTDERFGQLLDDVTTVFTPDEIAEGWHFCPDWDGLPVGPGSPEVEVCTCPKSTLKPDVTEELEPDLPPELMLRSVLRHDIEQTFLLLSYPENIRVLWRHVNTVLKKIEGHRGQRIASRMCASVTADYADGLLVTLAVNFWMQIFEDDKSDPTPYNIQLLYEGNGNTLELKSQDLGRFNGMAGLAGDQNRRNVTGFMSYYQQLHLEGGVYTLLIPGLFDAPTADPGVPLKIKVPRSLVLDRSRPRNSDPFRPV